MRITIDTLADSDETLRSLIGFLMHLRPSLADEEVPEGTTLPKVNTAAPSHTAAASAGASAAANTTPTTPTAPTGPAPASNVVNFPVPPPPSATTAAGPSSTSSPAPTAAGAQSVASAPAEYDSAGIPWDARIHQKAKGKKKDGTWKLIKGIDEAVVQTVTVELAARKIATQQSPTGAQAPTPPANVPPPPPAVGAVPPPPATVAPQVFLPDANNAEQQNSVPVPPVPSNAAAPAVPAQNGPAAPSVPVPPVSPAGPVGVTYRSIIDKMTAGTRENKLTAAKVLEIVTGCGVPNLQQLNQMPNTWADVDAKIDLALAGLL